MGKTSIVSLIILALLVVLLYRDYKGCNVNKDIAEPDTLRVVVYDTIPYYKPIPRDSVVVRYITERLPIVDSLVDKVDSSVDKVGSSVDSVAVEIPITHKVYEDSNYTAWVSGYKPSLDSLRIYQQTQTITIVERKKPKRWSVGVTAGYGITMQGSPQLEPFIGIGLTYNLWSF